MRTGALSCVRVQSPQCRVHSAQCTVHSARNAAACDRVGVLPGHKRHPLHAVLGEGEAEREDGGKCSEREAPARCRADEVSRGSVAGVRRALQMDSQHWVTVQLIIEMEACMTHRGAFKATDGTTDQSRRRVDLRPQVRAVFACPDAVSDRRGCFGRDPGR